MDIQRLLGDAAEDLLTHESKGIPKDDLHLPGPDFVERVFEQTDRTPQVLRNLQSLFDHGRLGGTGYVSILPVDQGIEHSAAASFAPNPKYFDPQNIVELAIEGGCNAVASTFGVLGRCPRRYAHRIPFIVKLNHNELLTLPNKFDQVMFGNVEQAYDLGAAGVGATIYFGSEESTRQLQEVSEAFAHAHQLGMFTVLWCYLRNSEFKQGDVDYHLAADLTGQANHIGVTIEADIIKQKLPDHQRRLQRVQGLRQDESARVRRAHHRPSDRLVPMAGRELLPRPLAGLINSGGESKGASDLADAVHTAVVNKRAGGTGLDHGSQGVPAADVRGHRAPQRRSGRLPDTSITIA